MRNQRTETKSSFWFLAIFAIAVCWKLSSTEELPCSNVVNFERNGEKIDFLRSIENQSYKSTSDNFQAYNLLETSVLPTVTGFQISKPIFHSNQYSSNNNQSNPQNRKSSCHIENKKSEASPILVFPMVFKQNYQPRGNSYSLNATSNRQFASVLHATNPKTRHGFLALSTEIVTVQFDLFSNNTPLRYNSNLDPGDFDPIGVTIPVDNNLGFILALAAGYFALIAYKNRQVT